MAREPKASPGANAEEDDVLPLAEDAPPRPSGPARSAADDLAETAVEVEIPPEEPLGARGPTPVAQSMWSRQFGGAVDPEAGIFRVADKRFRLSVITKSPLTLLISSLAWFLAGSTLLILALILQDDIYTYSAPVLVPVAWGMCIWMWRKWKGRALFADRLVETLDGPPQIEGTGH